MDERSEELVVNNIPLVGFVMKNYGLMNHYLADDLIQEGTIGLMRASETYDSNKGYEFSTYAKKCIRNKIFNYLKSESVRTRNIIYTESQDFLDNITDDSFDLREAIDLNDRIRKVRESLESLSDELRHVFTYRFRDDFSYRVSGALIGFSPQTTMRREAELKSIVRQSFIGEEVAA